MMEVIADECLIPETTLGGLGFVSPVKVNPIKEKGYFRRPCSKVEVDSIGVKAIDHLGVSSHFQVREHVCSLDHQSWALRAVFSHSRFSP